MGININALRASIDLKFFISLLLISLLPSFFFVFFNASSLAVGLLLSSFLVFFIYMLDKNSKRINENVLFFYSLLFLALFVSGVYFFMKLGNAKPLLSMFLVIGLMPMLLMGHAISYLNYKKIQGTIFFVILLLISLGVVKLFWIPEWGNYSSFDKPVFPFSEESHYSLILGFFSMIYTLNARGKRVYFVLFSLLLFSLVYPNLTMFLFFLMTLFSFALRLKTRCFLLFIFLFLLFLILFFVFLLDYSPYFKSRLTLDGLDNLTTLVFLQGWSLSYLNFFETAGLGLGFQMLGEDGTKYSYFTDVIFNLTGGSLNVSDGGFLAAKLIAEFGVLGIITVFIYFLFLCRFVLKTNKMLNKAVFLDKDNSDNIRKKIIFSAFFWGFFVEFFFRGYGYFSPSLFMLICAGVAFYKIKKLDL